MAEIKAIYQDAFEAFLRNDYDAAIEGYGRAVGLDPTFALGYQGLAEAHSRKGDLDKAVDAIAKAIGIDPEEPLYRTSLSRFYQMQGRIAEAEEESANAARLQSRRSF
jgi:tetratricopeptide (TPR) repeat protein